MPDKTDPTPAQPIHAARLSPTFGTGPQPDIEGMLDVLSLRQENASLRQQFAECAEHTDLAPHEKCTCRLCKALGRAEHAEAEVARLREALQKDRSHLQ